MHSRPLPRSMDRLAARATLLGIALAIGIVFMFWGPR